MTMTEALAVLRAIAGLMIILIGLASLKKIAFQK